MLHGFFEGIEQISSPEVGSKKTAMLSVSYGSAAAAMASQDYPTRSRSLPKHLQVSINQRFPCTVF
jgi:hypothetical protein